MKIKAYIVNRNLLTTLKSTVDFLSKEPRVEVVVYDQQSTYPPLLEYYKTQNVIYNTENGGPYSVWKLPNVNDDYYIVADSDCTYEGVPDNWLDVMLESLKEVGLPKVGFALSVNDLPDNPVANEAKELELRYRLKRCRHGWLSSIDTVFCLYRPKSEFSYNAIKLFPPYEIKHVPWYLDETMSDEWKYYLEHASKISTWGMKLKEQYL